MDEGFFTLHGKNLSGNQHGEGGSSAATRPSGGTGHDRSALQVASGRLGNAHPTDEPHGGSGEPHGSVSRDEADDWACPIVEEPIPNDFN